MQHTRLIRAAKYDDDDNDSGMDEEIDANEIQSMKKSGGRALGFMPDNGDGQIEIWRIDNNKPVQVEREKFGILFGSKTYVMKYHYRNKQDENGVVIYYWQVMLKHYSYLRSFFPKKNIIKTPQITVNYFRVKMHQPETKHPQQFTHRN